ncbi:PLP-dependent transferase, partial [candidate division KSB1 bacterium]|nr:PLP-dependent transferase [candidate division KSB1 bacterium]
MSQIQKVKAQPVGGYHGVTVELPTVQMNLDYEEKKIELDRGYVRFVLHPDVREVETQAAAKFGAKKALAFISPESALYVLMDGLFQKGRKGICVQGKFPEKMLHFLMQTAGEIIPVARAEEAEIIIHDLSIPKKPVSPANKIIIGFDAEGKISPENVGENYQFLITGYPKNECGILLFYSLALLDEISLVRRHTGFNLNSRPAEQILQNRIVDIKSPEIEVKTKLTRLEKTATENVYLFPTGMGAISAAILTHLSPTRPKMVMIGSPYVDTRCILEKWPARRGTPESIFLDIDDLAGMKNTIDEKTALVICEIPTNPLVRVPDLQQVVQIAHRNGASVLVDSTIASPYNLNPFDYNVDLIAHSATKSLNGKNDLIGGVLFVQNAPS